MRSSQTSLRPVTTGRTAMMWNCCRMCRPRTRQVLEHTIIARVCICVNRCGVVHTCTCRSCSTLDHQEFAPAGPLPPAGPADADLPDAVLHCLPGHSSRLGSLTAASRQIRRICQQLWPGYHTEGLRRRQAKWLKVRCGQQCRTSVHTTIMPHVLSQSKYFIAVLR